MYGSRAAKSYGSGGSTCRVSGVAVRCSFTCAIAMILRSLVFKPRIARHGSLHILAPRTCCPLPHPEALVAEFLLRWLHYLGGITWIGLLYYFNFVQGPFMAEADPAAKSTATQKLVPRALRWFRGGAILTFLTGLAIIGKRIGESPRGVGWPGERGRAGGGAAGVPRVAHERRLFNSHAVLHGRGVALHPPGRRQSRRVLGERAPGGGAPRNQFADRDQRRNHEADRKDSRRDRHRLRRVGHRVRDRAGVPIALTA